MRKLLEEKEGFTLIELLIVITIIALLAVSSVYAYLSYKKGALLDFAADNIVAQFYQMRSETVYGQGNSERFDLISDELGGADPDTLDFDIERESKCYGIKYDAALNELHSFEVDFSDQKKWDSSGETWKYEGCSDPTGADSTKLEYDELIQILSVDFDGEEYVGGVSDFYFVFFPPEGDARYWDVANAAFADASGDGLLALEIQYGEKDEDRFKRRVNLDLINQTASVEKY